MTGQMLVGKYFIGVHDECMRSGIIEAAIGDGHYLVRFDDLVGFTDGSKWPEALAIVALKDMVKTGDDTDDDPPPWWFFDNPEQRSKYEDWSNQPPSDRTPRVVPLR